jgi:hypothetical protein
VDVFNVTNRANFNNPPAIGGRRDASSCGRSQLRRAAPRSST